MQRMSTSCYPSAVTKCNLRRWPAAHDQEVRVASVPHSLAGKLAGAARWRATAYLTMGGWRGQCFAAALTTAARRAMAHANQRLNQDGAGAAELVRGQTLLTGSSEPSGIENLTGSAGSSAHKALCAQEAGDVNVALHAGDHGANLRTRHWSNRSRRRRAR
jgi:hypothetical protein